MRRSSSFRRMVAIMAFWPVLALVPPAVWAQDDDDLQFDEEDETMDSDLEFNADDETMDSDDSDLQFDDNVIDSNDSGMPIVTGFVVPSDSLNEQQALQLSDLIVSELARLPGIQ